MGGFYRNLTAGICRRETLRRIVVTLCRMLPWFFVFSFAVTFLILIATWNLKWIFFLIVPAVSVLVVSFLRAKLNYPRPFEVYKFPPLVQHKPGKSFPSRHTTSAVAIGMACLYVNWIYGTIMLVLAGVVALSRVLSGVHFFRDVIFGAAISVAFGLLGFSLIAPWCGL